MARLADWPQVESKVHFPGQWLFLIIGSVFVVAGTTVFFVIAEAEPPGLPVWVARFGPTLYAALGAIVLAACIYRRVSPVSVQHAPADALPELSREPVIREGSVVYGRATYELAEEPQRWHFRPARRHRRNDLVFLVGFGVPFLTVFAALLSWVLHERMDVGDWHSAILLAVVATLLTGGSALAGIGTLMRAAHRSLGSLSIPRHGADLELQLPAPTHPDQVDLIAGLGRAFVGESNWRHLTIPREQVVAVQLCPWRYALKSNNRTTHTWAVQGVLVIEGSGDERYERLPMVLTSDHGAAARLMQRLAATLEVPYLFYADAEGWQAERRAAKTRPPIRSGGVLS